MQIMSEVSSTCENLRNLRMKASLVKSGELDTWDGPSNWLSFERIVAGQ